MKLLLGDCTEVLPTIESGSVDTIATDPPYGISFLSMEWDTAASNAAFEEWCVPWLSECFRVLKPGGDVTIFSSPRTFHRVVRAMKRVGFSEVQVKGWVQTQGFPKSHDLGKYDSRFKGYGHALKPSWEPALVGLKPAI